MIITKKKYDEVEKRNVELASLLRDACKEIKNLKHLKLQEEAKVENLKKKNRKLQEYQDQVKNITNGLRTPEEKIDKIKALPETISTCNR